MFCTYGIILKNDFFAGSNYANTGSEHHFHIHLIKKQPGANYGFAKYIDKLNYNIYTPTAHLYTVIFPIRRPMSASYQVK